MEGYLFSAQPANTHKCKSSFHSAAAPWPSLCPSISPPLSPLCLGTYWIRISCSLCQAQTLGAACTREWQCCSLFVLYKAFHQYNVLFSPIQHGNPDFFFNLAMSHSILAWRIPWTKKPGGLPSIGLHRVGHDWVTNTHTHTHTHTHTSHKLYVVWAY